jgi:hypothetical protein
MSRELEKGKRKMEKGRANQFLAQLASATPGDGFDPRARKTPDLSATVAAAMASAGSDKRWRQLRLRHERPGLRLRNIAISQRSCSSPFPFSLFHFPASHA